MKKTAYTLAPETIARQLFILFLQYIVPTIFLLLFAGSIASAKTSSGIIKNKPRYTRAGKNIVAPPTLSYSSPQTYITGTAITALVPTSSGVAAPGYNTPVTIGGGFSQPTDVAVDIAGNVYVADRTNSQVKKIPVGGGAPIVIGSTFSAPYGVAVDVAGNVFVADYNTNSVRKISVNGGSTFTVANGFSSPTAVAVDIAGNLYVADQGNNAIKMIPANGAPVISLVTGVSQPQGVAVDGLGNVYYVGSASTAVSVLPANGGAPFTIGSGLLQPACIDVDAAGNVYVADRGNNALKKIPAGGGTPIVIGSGFSNPFGVTTDVAGIVYVDDFSNSSIKKMLPTGGFYISDQLPAGLSFDGATGTISGTPTKASPAKNYTITAYNASGATQAVVNITVTLPPPPPTISYTNPHTYINNNAITPLTPATNGIAPPGYNSPVVIASGFNGSLGVAVDGAGNVYVADRSNNAVKKIPVGGGPAVIIGSGFSLPYGVAVNLAGDVYVADYGNNAIKMIPAAGGAPVSVGTGFNHPTGVAIDAAGNVFVADMGNNMIEKIAAGSNNTLLFAGGFSSPTGVAVDASGNVYVADYGNNAIIRVAQGTLAHTTMGSGFATPAGVAVDGLGNIFVADFGNGAVKEIPVTGGAPVAISAGFGTPYGVATDGFGNVYVADFSANSIKKVTPTGGVYLNEALPQGLSLNGSTGVISGTPTVASLLTTYKVTAYNAYGATSTTVAIQTKKIAAATLNYTKNNVYTINNAIPQLAPAANGVGANGGTGNNFTISGGLYFPRNAVLDAAGNIYVLEPDYNQVKKILADGSATTVVLSGIPKPSAIAVDAAGNIFIAHNLINTIKKYPVGGGAPVTISSNFQVGDLTIDAVGNIYAVDINNGIVKKIPVGGGATVNVASGFNIPQGIAVDAAGNIYIGDTGNNAVKKIPAGGGPVVTLGSGFNSPMRIALDVAGNIYVADQGNFAIKKIPVGGGAPIAVGPAFGYFSGIAVNPSGVLFSCEYYKDQLNVTVPSGGYFLDKTLPAGLAFDNTTGIITGTPTVANTPVNYTITAYNDGGGTPATFSIEIRPIAPAAITYNTTNGYNINTAITPLVPSSTGVGAPGYNNVVTVVASGFGLPQQIARDTAGNLYVSDYINNAIKKIPAGGGTPIIIGSGFNHPIGVAVDKAGNVYVGDNGNSAIKKIIAASGTTVTLSTAFFNPTGVAVDLAGNVYVSDNANNAIRELPVGGGASILLGTGFSSPAGLVVDAKGAVYVADSGHDKIVKIVPGVSQTTFASGFSNPTGVAIDSAGNVFVADRLNNAVVEIQAGNGSAVVIGTAFNSPTGLAVDPTGNVYVADFANNVIKKITPNGGYYINPVLPAGLGLDITSGTVSGTPTSLSPLTNYTVTAYNDGGSSTTAFNLKVTSNNANLKSLTLSAGALSPIFTSGVINYTANASTTTASITVTPTVTFSGATVTVNGTAVASGSASVAIPLVIGANTITTVVTAQNGTSTKTYTVVVNRLQTYAANLVAFKGSSGTLSPVFASNTTNYTSSVASSVASITITPTLRDTLASVTVNGIAVVTATPSQSIPLAFGTDTIKTVVTAVDGVTTKTYTLIVTRPLSSNANLSALTISAGTLSPVFASGTSGYTAMVSNSMSALTVTPTVSDISATVKVNGTAVTSGAASAALPLAVGSNIIHVVVTAQNAAVKTYTLTITRAAGNDASLSNLLVSAGTLSPAFATGTNAYTVNVTSATSSIKITPTNNDPNATIKVNGASVTSGTASAALPLVTGPNAINVVVTAPDGTTVLAYGVTVIRTSSNANLSGLALSSGPLSPVFAAGTTVYTSSVSNATTTTTITPTTSDAAATVTVNGVSVTSGSPSAALPLAIGNNVITTKVIAFDGTAKTYKVTVNRIQGTDATLAGLSASVGALSPVFATATTNYTSTVTNATVSIKLTPVTNDVNATVTVNGATVASGTASGNLSLATGNNTITTVVTASDGVTTKTYTIIVTRTSSNANLSALALSAGTLSPVFAAGTSVYTSAVSNATTTVMVTPTTSDAAATVTVNGASVSSGTASAALPLVVGSNLITLKVTAFDNTVKTYKVTITRATGPLSFSGGGNFKTAFTSTPDSLGAVNADVNVHQGLSPNGDGINDVLVIDGIDLFTDNNITIVNRSGQLVFETKGYDNNSRVFDGHSNKNGRMQLPGTYFYSLEYKAGNETKHKTGYIILKY